MHSLYINIIQSANLGGDSVPNAPGVQAPSPGPTSSLWLDAVRGEPVAASGRDGRRPAARSPGGAGPANVTLESSARIISW